MKRKAASFLILLFYGLNAFCQNEPYKQGFIVNWAIGYSWHTGNNQTIPAPLINTRVYNLDGLVPMANSSDADGSYKLVHDSYGHGLNVGLHFGYMFNPYLGIDLGVAYSKSAMISASQLHEIYLPDSLGVLGASGNYVNCQLTTQSQSLILSPAIIAAYSKPKFKIYPYLRLGLALPVWTQLVHNVNMQYEGDFYSSLYSAPYLLGVSTTSTWQTQTNFSVGFNGAVGFVYRPFGFLSFFAEISGQYLNVKANYSVITQYSADGNDLTQYRGAYRTDFVYVHSLNANSNNAANNANYDPNQPKQDISPVFPYSNIGFNVGVQLLLNKKVFKDEDGFGPVKPKTKKVKKSPTEPIEKPAQ